MFDKFMNSSEIVMFIEALSLSRLGHLVADDNPHIWYLYFLLDNYLMLIVSSLAVVAFELIETKWWFKTGSVSFTFEQRFSSNFYFKSVY